MELINNTTKTLKEDLAVEIKKGSKLSIAAACFSIYAFQELKKELCDIEELRFIFNSPAFTTEKAKKEKKLTIAQIAEKANLPKGTVQNIFCGYIPNPRVDTAYTKGDC